MRKSHKNAISGITNDRVNKPEKGVEASDKNLDTIEAALEANSCNIPESEMLDAEVQKLKSPSDSRWASSSTEDAVKAPGLAETYKETVAAPEK